MICGDQGIFKQKCRADEPFGYAQDRLRVNQRLMSPYFGDLAEWLCKAIRRMRIPFGGRRYALRQAQDRLFHPCYELRTTDE